MTSKGEEEITKKRVESLGWLTESTIMPKKHKAIEGVGASSILELKAHLYQSQQELQQSKDLPNSSQHRAKKKISHHDPFNFKNSGVDSRAHKDKLELKAVNDGSVSYAALERKVQLYDKLARGELSDEEEAEKYCVDFFSKSVMESGPNREERREAEGSVGTMDEANEGSDLFGSKVNGPGRAVGEMDREEHKRFVREVHNEASVAREKASEVKSRRQEQAAMRREKLKQAFLKKKLEKLKAVSKSE